MNPKPPEGATVSLTLGQKIFAGVAVFLLTTMAAMVFDARSQIAELRGDNAVLQVELRHLRELIQGGMDDRYRATQARADFALRDSRIATLEASLGRLEGEFRAHVVQPWHSQAIEDRLRAIEKAIERKND